MARLILSLRGRELDKFLVGKGKVTIGRMPDCDIKIDNPAISRRHAEIEFRDGGHYLVDLGSSNGTFHNGARVEAPVELHPGDVIGIAKFELLFQDDARSEVEKMTGGMDMEATMMVDSEKMAQAFQQVSGDSAPAASGPRKLVVLKGDADKKEMPIERDTITIGKADSCDLVVKGFFLEKIEATLTGRQGKYYLNPLGGSVKVNEEKLDSERPLKVGDTFMVGKTVIAFT